MPRRGGAAAAAKAKAPPKGKATPGIQKEADRAAAVIREACQPPEGGLLASSWEPCPGSSSACGRTGRILRGGNASASSATSG